MDDFKILLSAAIDQAKAQTKLNADIAKLKTEALKLGIEIDDKTAKQAIQKLSKEQEAFYKRNLSAIDLETKKRIEQSKIYSNQIKSQIQEQIRGEKQLQSELNLKTEKVQLSNNIDSYLKNNTRLSKDLKNELLGIQSRITSVDKTGLNNLRNEMKETISTANALNQTGDNFANRLVKNAKQLFNFLSSATVIMGSINAIKDMVSNVAELDKQILELSKVSDLSADGLARVTDEAFRLGDTVGKTGTQVLSAITSFKRAGFELQDSMKLATEALKMTNVAEGITDAGIAAENLVHIIKGFGEDSSFSTKILDSINQVSNTQAIDFDNLVDGAERLSAVANQAGLSFDQMLGTLTGGYEVLGNMEKVSSGLITIFSRMRAVQLEGEEEVKGVSELQEIFNKATDGVVNIVDKTTGQLRNTYDVLNELNGIWDTLDKNTQEGLSFEAAGIRQKSVFLSVMENWDNVKKSVESAADSMGSADIENQKYLDSLSGKLSKMSSQFQELSKEVVDDNFLKSLVDSGTGALEFLTELIDKFGLLNIALVSSITLAGAKTGAFATLFGQIQMLILAQTGYTASTVSAALAQVGLVGAIKATTTAMISFLTTNPVGWAILAGTAIFGAVKAYDALNVSLEENQEKLSELKGKYDSISGEVKSLEEQLSLIHTKMKDLEALKPIDFVEDEEYKKLSESNDELDRRLTIQRELLKVAGKEAEKKAVQTIETKSEESLTQTEDSYSNTGANRADLVTRTDAIQERIDAYNKLTPELDKLEQKQLSLVKAEQTESTEYKNLIKDIDDLTEKRDSYREYVLTTINALNSESDSIVGATDKGIEYSKIIENLGINVDKFLSYSENSEEILLGSVSATEDLANVSQNAVKTIEQLAEELEKQNKTIDNYQKSIKTISDAISSDALSSSDLIDLMQEFSDFDWSKYGVSGASGVGDINGALNALSISLRSSLDDTLQFNPALQKFYEETMNASEGIADFSESISSTEQKSKEFYIAVLGNLSDTIKTQAESYNLDFDNYKSLIEAKQALDEEYARQQQALVNAQMNFQNVMYSGDVERIKQLGLAYIDTQKSFNNYFKLTTDFNASAVVTNDTYKKDPKDLAEKAAKEAEEARQKAIQDVKNKFAKEDDANKFLVDTGKMTESTYYEKLQALNKKYFEGKADFLAEDRQNQVTYYKWDKEQAEKAVKEKLKLTSNATDRILSLYDRSQSQSKNIGDSYTDGSDEQIKAYSDGLASVNQEISYINKQITKLNKMKLDGVFKDNEDEYVSQLKTLQDALYDTTSSAKNFTDAMAESAKSQQEDISKFWENQQDKVIKSLEDEKEAYDDIIDAQKEIIDLKEKQRDYENSIAKQTKEISQIESRMADLQLAVSSGDTKAGAELRKLDEERAKKKDELAEDQHDHEVDLQQTALDKAKDDYDKLHEDKMTALDEEHKKQIDDINDIYNNMILLIKNSANMLDTEFGTKLQGYLSQLNSFGIVPSDEFVNGIKGGQTQFNTKEQALSILQNGNGTGKGTSELNSYVKSNFGGKQLSYEQMAQLASIFGFGGVTAENIKSDTITKNMILEQLKRLFSNSTFATGGIVKASSSNGSGLLSDLLKSLGEDKFIAARNGEALLNKEETKVFKYDFIPTMNKFMTAFKPTLPDMSNIVTNNNSPIQIANLLSINGNVDSAVVKRLETSTNNLAQQVAKAIIDIKRTK